MSRNKRDTESELRTDTIEETSTCNNCGHKIQEMVGVCPECEKNPDKDGGVLPF